MKRGLLSFVKRISMKKILNHPPTQSKFLVFPCFSSIQFLSINFASTSVFKNELFTSCLSKNVKKHNYTDKNTKTCKTEWTVSYSFNEFLHDKNYMTLVRGTNYLHYSFLGRMLQLQTFILWLFPNAYAENNIVCLTISTQFVM